VRGDDTRGDLFLSHFQAEIGNAMTALRDVERELRGESRLADAWSGTQHDELTAMESAGHVVDGGDACLDGVGINLATLTALDALHHRLRRFTK
jgi:hypothetical protein